MRKPITSDMVLERQPYVFIAEASTLGLAPGEWPRLLPTTLGNCQPFVKRDVLEDTVHYEQFMGCIRLLVIND